MYHLMLQVYYIYIHILNIYIYISIYIYKYNIYIYMLGMVCICIQPISIWFEQCAAATRICGFAMLCLCSPLSNTCVQPRIST